MKKLYLILTAITVLALAAMSCGIQFVGSNPTPAPQQIPQNFNPEPQGPQNNNPGPQGPNQGDPMKPGPQGPGSDPLNQGPNPNEGGGPSGNPGGGDILLFTADQLTLKKGECTNLHWETRGGFGVKLNGQPVQPIGQQQVCPQQTMVYGLELDTGDQMLRREVTITVNGENQSSQLGNPPTKSSGPTQASSGSGQGCAGAPVIPYFTSSSASISAGQSVTLSWGNVTNGNNGPLVASVTIQPGLGEVGSGQSSRTVKPSTTTTYILTATGCGGTKTKQVTVTVGASTNVNLGLVNIFVRPGDGHVMATFRNSGNVNLSTTTTLNCANGPGNGAIVSKKTVTLNLKPGEIFNQDTGWTTTTASGATLTCSFTPPSGDTHNNDDSMKKKIP